MFLRISIAVLALVLAQVSAGQAHEHTACNKHPGDYLGADHRCHMRHSPVTRVSTRPYAVLPPESEPEVSPKVVTPNPASDGKQPSERKDDFKMFTDRCAEQALKRGKIYDKEVVPDLSGNEERGAHCHVQGGFTEKGAI